MLVRSTSNKTWCKACFKEASSPTRRRCPKYRQHTLFLSRTSSIIRGLKVASISQ
jgi:hypothetical protein